MTLIKIHSDTISQIPIYDLKVLRYACIPTTTYQIAASDV